MSFSNVNGALGSNVAPAGTFTISYPTGKDKGNFYLSMKHKLSMGQDMFYFPDDFDLTFNASDITVTNKTSASTWLSGSAYVVQLQEVGERPPLTIPQNAPNTMTSSVSGQGNIGGVNNIAKIAASTAKAETRILVLGAPETADVDGVCAAQAVASATNATINGAYATSGVATLDVPRGLVVDSTNAGDTTQTITVTGTDVYGWGMTETIALNGTTAVEGKKAFKTITEVAVSAALTGNLTVGTTDILGLPEFVPSAGFILAEIRNGEQVGPGGAAYVPFFINQTDLLAPTSQYVYSPAAGNISRLNVIVTSAINTGGNITVGVGSATVTGLTVAVAGSAAVGTAYTDTPTAGAANTAVVPGSAIVIIPDASFATSGAVNGSIVIAGSLDGTFVAGTRTAGGATATTGDVRGTYKPSVACDGTTVFDLIVAWPGDYAGQKQYLA